MFIGGLNWETTDGRLQMNSPFLALLPFWLSYILGSFKKRKFTEISVDR